MKKENLDYIVELPSGIVSAPLAQVAEVSAVGDSETVFDEDGIISPLAVDAGGVTYKYAPFGKDNLLPYKLISKIQHSTVMSQNKFFNILACYGQGFRLVDAATRLAPQAEDVADFIQHNALPKFFLEQITDLKTFYFSVAVVLLNRAGDKIVGLRHKEACYCRFEMASKGKINHVLYANWRFTTHPKDVEVIPLLDDLDPLGDLKAKMDGRKRLRDRKFAIVTRFPTLGFQYYPIPYYSAVFRDGWYDISQLIGIGKRAKLKNTSSVSYHVEIHREYWRDLFRTEHITDREKQQERINKEKKNIENFLLGIQNQGKVWISGYYSSPDGKGETHLVRITRVDGTTAGGDYSSDIEEANNVLAYADNTHPNLIGAAPGKSGMNNSGSDKRELFTLKQSLEKAFKDLLRTSIDVIIGYNGWKGKVDLEMPMVLLTTLDKNTDAKEVKAE